MSLVSASAANLEELDSFSLDSIQSELTNWQQIVFYGDMDGSSNPRDTGKDQSSRPPLTMPSTSAPSATRDESHPGTFTTVHPPPNNNPLLTAPPHVTPEAYNYLIHTLLALQQSAVQQHYPQHAGSYLHANPPGQYTQPGPSTYGWPIPPGGPLPVSNINETSAGVPSMYQHDPSLLFQNTIPQMMMPQSQSTTQDVDAVPSTSTGENPEQTDEAISIAEDKRRRNTAASARFRIKKKLKTLNLERTVADLTGRTEELEREAADLRRENGWLKEIVLLKSRSAGGFGPAAAQPVESNRLRESQEGDGGSSSSGQGESGEKGKGKGTG
ncbi:hypothetical protein V8B97DRAFT_2008957 [Scleroderma yunnanense]